MVLAANSLYMGGFFTCLLYTFSYHSYLGISASVQYVQSS